MSILDEFWIIFKTNAKEADKDTKKLKKGVDGLEGGIKDSDKASINLGKKFSTLASQALAAFGLVLSVTSAISAARGATAQATDLTLMGEALGESSSELVSWSRAVEANKGSAKAFMASVRGISMALGSAHTGTSNAASLSMAKLGVNVRDSNKEMRSMLDLLPDMAEGLLNLKKNFGLDVARTVGMEAGLDLGSVMALLQGREALLASVSEQRKLNPVTDEDLERLSQMDLLWKSIKNSISDLFDKSLLGVADPAGTGAAIGVAQAERGRARVIAADAQAKLIGELLKGAADLIRKGARGLGEHFTAPQSGERLEFFGPGDKTSMIDLSALRSEIVAMAATPLSALGAQALAGNASSRSTSLSIGEVNVHTQATDASGIAASVSSEMATQLSNAVEQTDDGIAA